MAFLTLKTLPEEPGSEVPGLKLTREARNWCIAIGSSAESVEDIIKLGDQNFFFAVQVSVKHLLTAPYRTTAYSMYSNDCSIMIMCCFCQKLLVRL